MLSVWWGLCFCTSVVCCRVDLYLLMFWSLLKRLKMIQWSFVEFIVTAHLSHTQSFQSSHFILWLVCVCVWAAATEESAAVWWTLGVKPRGRRLLRTKGQSCCQVNDLWPLTKTLTSVILFNTQQSTQCLLSLCFPLLCDHQQFPPKP